MGSTATRTALYTLFFCLFANSYCLSALMDMQLDENRIYEMSHGTSVWESTLNVVGQEAFGGNTYFELRETGYDPGVQKTLYIRSTDTEILAWNGAGESVLFETGAIGHTWQVDDEVTRRITGVNVEVTVPYGTFFAYEYEAYRDDQNNGAAPYQRHYIVPGIGFVQEIDWWDSDESDAQIQALSDIHIVPIPGAAFLFGAGLISLVGLRQRRNKIAV